MQRPIKLDAGVQFLERCMDANLTDVLFYWLLSFVNFVYRSRLYSEETRCLFV